MAFRACGGQAAARSSLQTEKEVRAGLAAELTELTELRKRVEQLRVERGGWQERLRTLAAVELKAAECGAAQQKERAAVAKLKELRAEHRQLQKQVGDLEADLAAQADARRDEAAAACERDECKARECQVRRAVRSLHGCEHSPRPMLVASPTRGERSPTPSGAPVPLYLGCAATRAQASSRLGAAAVRRAVVAGRGVRFERAAVMPRGAGEQMQAHGRASCGYR